MTFVDSLNVGRMAKHVGTMPLHPPMTSNSHSKADANDTSAPMQIDRVKDEGKRRRPIRARVG